MLLGVVLSWSENGTLDISSIQGIGGGLILISLLIKIGAFGLHYWYVDLVEGGSP